MIYYIPAALEDLNAGAAVLAATIDKNLEGVGV